MAPGTHLPSLTGLRWIAALLVFGFHVQVGGRLPDATATRLVQDVFGAGATGVSFFFLLSGFVLMWSSARERPGEFWWRRFARVYPLHAATAVLALIVGGGLPPVPVVAANLTLVQAWSPDHAYYQGLNAVSWTLSCEAFFYLMFPLLAAGIGRLRPDALTLTLIGAWLVIVAGPFAGGPAVPVEPGRLHAARLRAGAGRRGTRGPARPVDAVAQPGDGPAG
ncbi:acyltransferase family protein [Actinoplanes palleronii]|uniref:Acyltransferase 3 domain-containing protein n=1 Tax=Actinoplanes palleronii TaxID=113570 RepID=A0ABQ4B5Q6_9ACTN|nr:acyltransferase [Actinoplanes palleronii]GIE66007.1 hypothetical protein Apa02nite_021150 [Actinoplanes palleronii]